MPARTDIGAGTYLAFRAVVLPDAPDRGEPRFITTALGTLFLAQGAAKLVAPSAYFAALACFPLVPARAEVTFGVAWIATELGAGASLVYAGRGRAGFRIAVVSALLGLFVAIRHLGLTTHAWAVGAEIDNCTSFGAFLPQPLSVWVPVQDACMVVWAALVLRGIVSDRPRAGRLCHAIGSA